MDRRKFLVGSGLGLAGSMTERMFGDALSQNVTGPERRTTSVDFGKTIGTLPHYWENAAGSDRTAVGLRDQWRQDLMRAHRDTGIRSVRCHGLFDDEMGIAAAGAGAYNFLYVDQVYDKMLEIGVRPYVELSFMPEAFASGSNRVFFYKGNVSPPRNWQDWHDMVQAFTAHCVRRYGIGEVSRWKFEVWNEPNINFWAGTQEEYFELYRQSVLAVKSVDKRLQVGGPATARLDWIPEVIQYCSSKGLPLDFISTHIYATDPQQRIFGRDHAYPFEQVIPRGVEHVKHQIEASAMPRLPLWITEWSSQNPAFIADTIKNCIGFTETMSYWTFSNVFEEQGVPRGILNSGFGMLGQWGIARPSLHTFALLHRLGEKRLDAEDGPILATERADGSIAILAWNLIPVPPGETRGNEDESEGATLTLNLQLKGLKGRETVRVSQVNREVGSASPAWRMMGSPEYPSEDQLKQLRAAAELPKPETRLVGPGDPATFPVELPPDGIALLEFEK